MPNICHISFSASGGAGRVASQLVAALPQFGFSARLDVQTDTDIYSTIRHNPLVAATTILDNFIIKRTSCHQLFSLTRKSRRVAPDKFCRDDILHLHWIPGALQLSDDVLARSTKPIVWTMHDMWPITGGCHHALDCSGFTTGCSACPVVQPMFRSAVQTSSEKKRLALHRMPKFVICAPSKWLVSQVAQSSIAHDLDIRYVPNPVDPAFHDTKLTPDHPSDELIQRLRSIPANTFVVGFVAKNLDDSNKRFDLAVNAIRGISEVSSSRKIVLLAIGASRKTNRRLNMEILRTGTLHSVADRKLAYQRMDVLLAVSDAETAPLVIDEALACGTPVIVRNVGGAAESVRHRRSGFVCDSTEQISSAILELSAHETMRINMSGNAKLNQSHSLTNVINEYISIYSELIAE